MLLLSTVFSDLNLV